METGPEIRPRQLLVLATSGAFGGGFQEEGARLWPTLVLEALEKRLGPVELTLQRFYVHAGKPWEILETNLAEDPPDFIVLQCTSWPATQKTVAHRLERLLGKRAADWTEARVLDIDQRTRRRGRVRHTVNRTGHKLARRVVGTAPITSVRALIDGYLRAIDRLAMVETASVAIIGTGFASNRARQNNGGVDAIKRQFDGELSTAANKKHFGWVDSAAVTREADDPESQFLDQLHKGQAWHDGIAEQVVAQLLTHELAAKATGETAPA